MGLNKMKIRTRQGEKPVLSLNKNKIETRKEEKQEPGLDKRKIRTEKAGKASIGPVTRRPTLLKRILFGNIINQQVLW